MIAGLYLALVDFSVSLALAEGCVSTQDLSWVAIGDWGKPGDQQRSVVHSMAMEAASIHAQFLLLLGDNFYPNGVSSWEDEQFVSTYEDTFVASSLQIPHFAVLGNHDYYQDPQAQVERHYKTTSRWTMPHRWYSREFTMNCQPSILFVFIDTMMLSEGRDKVTLEQRQEHWSWLQDMLRKASADWIIVVGHHPVYSSGMHGDSMQLVNELKPLLDCHGVDIYFSGHDHGLEMLTDGNDSPTYIVSGSGSKVRRIPKTSHQQSQFAESVPGFVSSRLNRTHLHNSWISDSGVVLYEHVQLRRDKQPRTYCLPAPSSVGEKDRLTPSMVAIILVLSCLCCSTFVRRRSQRQHGVEAIAESPSAKEPYSRYLVASELSDTSCATSKLHVWSR